jgi:hypothetical protein
MRLGPRSHGGGTLERELLVDPWLYRSLDDIVAPVQRFNAAHMTRTTNELQVSTETDFF